MAVENQESTSPLNKLEMLLRFLDNPEAYLPKKNLKRRDVLKLGVLALAIAGGCNPKSVLGAPPGSQPSENDVTPESQKVTIRREPTAAETKRPVIPTDIPPRRELGNFSPEQVKHQLEINEEYWKFCSKGLAKNDRGEIGPLFNPKSNQRVEKVIPDPTNPTDPKSALVVFQVDGFLGGNTFTVPSRFVNKISSLDPQKFAAELQSALDQNDGFIPPGYGPLEINYISSNEGVPVRRDKETEIITQIIDENGAWAETMKPVVGVSRIGRVENIEIPFDFGLMKDITTRPQQPLTIMTVNPDRLDPSQDNLALNFLKLCFINHKMYYPEDRDMTLEAYLQEVESGRGLIKLKVADSTRVTHLTPTRKELQTIEYAPKSGVRVVADQKVHGIDGRHLRQAYAALTPEGRLFFSSTDMLPDDFDFTIFTDMLDMPKDKMLGTQWETSLAYLLSGAITADLTKVELSGGYAGEIIYGTQRGEIGEIRESMYFNGTNFENLSASEPPLVISGPWVK